MGGRKPSLKRQEISYRKIRTINYDQFWRDLENSRLVSDPLLLGLNLTDLVDLYNGTLKSLLDTHAPLMRKIVIIRPFHHGIRTTLDQRRGNAELSSAVGGPPEAI